MDLKDTVVVVTGAGGSIGSEICRQVLEKQPAELRLVSLTESALYRIRKQLEEYKTGTLIVGILGSIGNVMAMQEAMYGAELVIHAAAHKHVPICEENPIEAIANNVLGTANLAMAAREAHVDQFIQISTDKAVKPTSVMGATKRWCELILRDLIWQRMPGRPLADVNHTRFRIVRFGNVMDSDGSVVPLWREQIRAGGPVTLTDKRCMRYFMSIPEAAELVLGAIALPVGSGPGPYLFDMGEPRNMLEMAEGLIYRLCPNNDQRISPVKIVETGLRPGEKLVEELHYDGWLQDTEHPRIKYLVENIHSRLKPEQLHNLVEAVRDHDHTTALETLFEGVL